MADRRFGVPRTTAERTARHLSAYGTVNLPPRGTGLGAGVRPITLVKMDEEPIYFDRENSYWPTTLKADDPFDDNFKLTTIVGAISENKDIIVAVKYKGLHYRIGVAENIPPNTTLEWTWVETPTMREFIEALGGEITETTTIPLTWETGHLVDETHFILTDAIDTDIFVEVPGIDIMLMAVVGGIIIGAGAIAYVALKPKLARA